MLKYLIHCYPKRKWYVDQYLVPSLLDQGIDENDILVYNDEKGLGNLQAFLDSAKLVMNNEGATWHLQDDIVIGPTFKEMTEKYMNSIVCGFCNSYSDGNPGYVNIKDMWYSFPCIRILNILLKQFVQWMDLPIVQETYKPYIQQGKFDDSLFRCFMLALYPNNVALNLVPNIVDHVDFLLGGSIANNTREPEKDIRAMYFEGTEQVEELKRKIVGVY